MQTAAFATCGQDSPPTSQTGATELYDGSSWTNTATASQAAAKLAAAGTTTAGLKFGGENPPSTTLSSTEEYNAFGPSTATIETT